MSTPLLPSAQLPCPCCGRAVAGPMATDVCAACLLELGLTRHQEADPADTGRLLDYVRVVNIIGESPRAHVFLAEWITPGGGVVALKRGKRPALEYGARGEEVAALLRLDHPGLATLFEAGVDDHQGPYALTEYVPGLPITRYAERERLPLRDRVVLWLQAVDAVCYAHAHGIPHLNLKPSNVLVGGGVVKVLDFGASLPPAGNHADTRSGDAMSVSAADAQADVFAFGVMSRELVARGSSAALEGVIRTATAPARARYPTLEALAAAARAVSLD